MNSGTRPRVSPQPQVTARLRNYSKAVVQTATPIATLSPHQLLATLSPPYHHTITIVTPCHPTSPSPHHHHLITAASPARISNYLSLKSPFPQPNSSSQNIASLRSSQLGLVQLLTTCRRRGEWRAGATKAMVQTANNSERDEGGPSVYTCRPRHLPEPSEEPSGLRYVPLRSLIPRRHLT